MSPRSARIIRGSLLRKGFIEEMTHHLFFWLHVDGHRTDVYTFISHGAKECDDIILGRMAKQLMLTRAQLNDLIDCPMSPEEYVEILGKRGR
jgi:hypothetical protein